MSSCFSIDGETLWMLNGSAVRLVEAWQCALRRSEMAHLHAGQELESFFADHLLRAGPGMSGFDLDTGPLAAVSNRRAFAHLVRSVALDVVDAANESSPNPSWAYLATLDPADRAFLVARQRILVRWIARSLDPAPFPEELPMPEPLASASRAQELLYWLHLHARRYRIAGEAFPDQLSRRREACRALRLATGFLGSDSLRRELLDLADHEESLELFSESASTTRLAAELHEDAEEREIALQIASARASMRSLDRET